ncbi:hypothetical protein GLAREA_06234 [Glarea lozoyensis ATCC 20868]|uniref:Uncharacterized protein n=1 Tax=Glarea lozoyensis (strain ATCC 20868 / MF5171) TaxID=1116229 RepID=S3D431_GLAL2|nr:uncharacterized protein GLAREA_06234 [Glarea lozoyensis ATCC 20868]EPE33222.1 hypothetical protein GLAREA_06234 [Glarea lozoyensis ATCC 20868]
MSDQHHRDYYSSHGQQGYFSQNTQQPCRRSQRNQTQENQGVHTSHHDTSEHSEYDSENDRRSLQDSMTKGFSETNTHIDLALKHATSEIISTLKKEILSESSTSHGSSSVSKTSSYLSGMLPFGGSQVSDHSKRSSDHSSTSSAQGKWLDEKRKMEKSQQELLRKVQSAEKTISSLKATNREVQAALDHANKLTKYDSTNATEKIQNLEQMVREAGEANAKLKEIILSKATEYGQTIHAGTIIGKYTELREQIQLIVSRYFDLDDEWQPKGFATNDSPKLQQEFYSLYANGYTDDQMGKRARSYIFNFILEQILNKRCFGFENDHDMNFETTLGQLETVLFENLNANHTDEIVEWRRHTVKCASLLLSDSINATKLGKQLYELLSPFHKFRYDRDTPRDQKLYPELLVKLCEDALKFALMVRGTKSIYVFRTPDIGAFPDLNEVAIQDQEVMNRGGDKRISLVLSPALINFPEENRKRGVVLEKAHVVVRIE